jgi:hypothetical protein
MPRRVASGVILKYGHDLSEDWAEVSKSMLAWELRCQCTLCRLRQQVWVGACPNPRRRAVRRSMRGEKAIVTERVANAMAH